MDGHMTWRELRKYIKHMPKDQLDEPVYVWVAQEDLAFDGIYMVHECLDTCDGGKATMDNPYALDLQRWPTHEEMCERTRDGIHG